MASSSSSSSELWNFEVFLSFRGEDTRKTFVDHLYTALSQSGIHTYKDDETLRRGESIAPALFKAIEGSRIAVIVFSENYADSSWCLKEVAHIMKCKDERGQIVIPVFYHVDPSDVRKQMGKYGEAFAKHESESNNKVESWRKALVDAGNLSGWVSKDIANGNESKVIKEMVDEILNRLFPFDLDVDEDLVGMRARLQDLKCKLEIGSGDVRMAGIWGVGGGGKTTLASAVYDEISSKFDCCCFIPNIREESSKDGLEKLQESILSQVLKQKQMKVKRVEEGRRLIKSRLCHRNVLIVLDDVDHLDQLKALVGSHSWFGGGSRIIITTRDEHLLNTHKVKVIYNISMLNNDEANQLFGKHASSGYITIEDYEILSKKVITYAGGLPLALKVLGSFLHDKNKDEWLSALARLKEIPDNDIMEKLKISYDGLKPVEKELFLDIACFFRGDYTRIPMGIFDACGFHPVIGVKVLIQKALITVHNGEFNMHDLIQEMGHYIVRGEHPKNPEKHSRVWKIEEVRRTCDMVATMENHTIEALHYYHELSVSTPHGLARGIANMKKLRWIICSFYRGISLPTTFQPMELCYLELHYSNLNQLWEGCKRLPSLKVIDLSYSNYLIKTPDLQGLPCLEKMLLRGCDRLKEIHPSTGYHEGLVYLDMSGCLELEMFPPIVSMHKLETLIFSRCGQLCKFPEIQMNMCRFKHLLLDRTAIEVVPSSIGEYCINLQTLDLSGNSFSRIGSSLSQLARLKYLDISSCSRLVELPDLPSSIVILRACWCDSLEIVGDFPTNCKWLWNVSLWKTHTIGLVGVEKVVRSMLEGNAIEDYFMSIDLGTVHVPAWFYQHDIFRLQLPQNWNNDFAGFLICLVDWHRRWVKIIIKQEMHKDHQSDLLLIDETHKTETIGCMCFISFSSLRHTSWWNSIQMPSQISFFIRDRKFKVELVPRRKNKDDSIERAKATTDCSGYYDGGKTFKIKHDSKLSLEVEWGTYDTQWYRKS